MKKNLVILGNQFLCEKRMLNIVQRTVIMDEDAIDIYIHNHQLFKDQRAIVVDPELPVRSGFIFTGDAFVDPVNFVKVPIEGEVEEEEFDQKSSTNTTPEIVRWLENIMSEIRKLTGGVGNVPRNHNEETRAELIYKMNSIRNSGYDFGRLMRPMVYLVKEGKGNVDVYTDPSTESDLIGYYKGGDNIMITAFNNGNNFALLDTGGYIKFDARQLYILGDIKMSTKNTESGKIIAYVYDHFLPDIPGVTERTQVTPYTITEMRCYEETSDVPAENIKNEVTVDENPVGDEYSKEDKLRILIDEDYSVKDIAKEFNVNPSTIYKWMKKYNIKKSAE